MLKSQFSLPVVLALIVGLLLGFALGAYTYRGSSETAASDLEEGVLKADAEGGVGSVSAVKFSVGDQPAGNAVAVSEINFDKVAWLAVRDYQGGKLGNVLGARRLPAGTYDEAEVELLRPTAAGKNYAVVAFYDDGDLAFSSKKDLAVELEGEVLLSAFAAK